MDSDFEDLYDDDDEEIVNYIQRTYTIRNRPDNFNIWNEVEFFNRFRLSKNSVQLLLQEIQHLLVYNSDRNNAVPPVLQLLIALRFYASNDMYIAVGDFGGIHKTTAGKIVKRVTSAILTLRNQHIYLPRNERELMATQQTFYEIARFPRVVAAVDGTHIRMLSPGGPIAENFRCRKGYFSLNVQIACNAQYLITDIVSRWPGSAHDSTIFENSALRAKFEAGLFNNGVLLADSGYRLRNFVMTPIPNPENNPEALYNESHIRTRTLVERTIGIWKRRFPVLATGMRCSVPLMQDIIVAVAILHNIARKDNDPLCEELHEEYYIEDNDQLNIRDEQNGARNNTQRELIEYFASL